MACKTTSINLKRYQNSLLFIQIQVLCNLYSAIQFDGLRINNIVVRNNSLSLLALQERIRFITSCVSMNLQIPTTRNLFTRDKRFSFWTLPKYWRFEEHHHCPWCPIKEFCACLSMGAKAFISCLKIHGPFGNKMLRTSLHILHSFKVM